MAYRRCDTCGDETVCGIRPTMKAVRDAMTTILENTTLADVGRAGEALERDKIGRSAAAPV